MIRRILVTALLTGAIAGLFLTAIQLAWVSPLILEAETYEQAASHDPAGTVPHDDLAHGGHEPGWAPEDGIERLSYTFLSNLLAAFAFALLLAAAFSLRGSVDWRKGLLWGIAGFAAVHLAPALGQPPELPGTASGDLSGRQIWWFAAVAGAASGLALVVFQPRAWWKLLGVALIAAPHLVGAPDGAGHPSTVPAELASQFVAASLVTNFLFWIMMGASAGYFYRRFAA
jgi:cobalt transporter subunit CbtA